MDADYSFPSSMLRPLDIITKADDTAIQVPYIICHTDPLPRRKESARDASSDGPMHQHGQHRAISATCSQARQPPAASGDIVPSRLHII